MQLASTVKPTSVDAPCRRARGIGGKHCNLEVVEITRLAASRPAKRVFVTGVTPDNLGLDISEYQPLVQYGNTLNLDTLKPSTDLANQWLKSTRDPESTLWASKYQFRAAFVFVVIWIKGNCSAGAKSGSRSTGDHMLAREPKRSAFGSRLLPAHMVKSQPSGS